MLLQVFKAATISTLEECRAAADRVGYPLLLKASGGGGGKGIRLCYKPEELESALSQVKAEVVGSPVFLMQLCERARHIEVQIVGDSFGNAVALSGRDCSTQRRFQKIFEEAPPTVVRPETFKCDPSSQFLWFRKWRLCTFPSICLALPLAVAWR